MTRQQKERQRIRLARMYKFAQQIKDQAHLDKILSAIGSIQARGVTYELLKPMIKHFDAQYPDDVDVAQSLTRVYEPQDYVDRRLQQDRDEQQHARFQRRLTGALPFQNL